MTKVAALYVRRDSIYKTMAGVDAWDEDRDARLYAGDYPVVAHPPCKRWSLLNGIVLSRYPHKAQQFAWGADGGCFESALAVARRCGGVIEHPAESRAWRHFGLPRPGKSPDAYGGWTAEVRQSDWGHRAAKRTWLYVIGIGPDDLPPMPEPKQAVAMVSRTRSSRTGVELMNKNERDKTPPEFAAWLVELARCCKFIKEIEA